MQSEPTLVSDCIIPNESIVLLTLLFVLKNRSVTNN